MMKCCFRLTLILFFGLLAQASADVFVLKDGSKVKGRVLREDDAAYTLEVEVGPTIKDERRILKKDVLRVIAAKLDEEAFQKIRDLAPAPDGLSVEDYQQRIGDLSAFLKAYPASGHLSKVIAMRRELEAESRQVRGGALKIDGVMYSASDYANDAYEMDARAMAVKIGNLVEEGHHLQALRGYDQFMTEFRSTAARETLDAQIRNSILAHARRAAQLLASYDDRLSKRQDGLKTMTLRDRQTSLRAIEEQASALQKRFDAEKAAGVNWVSPHPFYKPSLEATISRAKQAIQDLEPDAGNMVQDGGALYRELLKLAKEGIDEKNFMAKLKEAEDMGIPERYLEILKNARVAPKVPEVPEADVTPES